LERRPYVRLIVLGNEPRHANELGPRIPKLPSEFDLCTNESHPLTRSSPCEAPRQGAIGPPSRREEWEGRRLAAHGARDALPPRERCAGRQSPRRSLLPDR